MQILQFCKNCNCSVTRLGDLLDFGHVLKPLATYNLPKSPTFLGNFCKGVKIFNFSSEIIFGQLLQTFGEFFLVTLSQFATFENLGKSLYGLTDRYHHNKVKTRRLSK